MTPRLFVVASFLALEVPDSVRAGGLSKITLDVFEARFHFVPKPGACLAPLTGLASGDEPTNCAQACVRLGGGCVGFVDCGEIGCHLVNADPMVDCGEDGYVTVRRPPPPPPRHTPLFLLPHPFPPSVRDCARSLSIFVSLEFPTTSYSTSERLR